VQPARLLYKEDRRRNIRDTAFELSRALTVLPWVDDLNAIDHLTVPAARHLNTPSAIVSFVSPNKLEESHHSHASWEQEKVQASQIRLLVPWHFILLDRACEHGIRSLCMGCELHLVWSLARMCDEVWK
jgi:hypothetical protein